MNDWDSRSLVVISWLLVVISRALGPMGQLIGPTHFLKKNKMLTFIDRNLMMIVQQL